MIYRGSVIELTADGWAWVRIPSLTGDSPVGPLPTSPGGLVPDEEVLVAALRGRTDDLHVVSRVTEASYVPTWASITGKPSTFAPAAHGHDWGDLSGVPTTFAPAAHTHTLDSGTGRLRFDQLPAFPEIPAGADLRTYVTDGTWHQSQNADIPTGANYPTQAAGLLEVRTSGTFVYQRYTVYNSGKEYTQSRYGTTWYPWREVPSRAELDAQINTRAASSHTHLWADLTDKPATFAPAAHTHLWAHITDKPGTFAPAAHTHVWADLTDKPLTFAPAAHTHLAAEISDASTVGRNVLKAADAAAARSAIGAGTSSLVIGTGGTNAMAGNRTFSYAELTGTVPTSALPPLAMIETTPVASQAAMLALPAQRGDVAIRTDLGKTFILATDSPGTLADWKEMLSAGQVTSVAGKVGVVSLVKADVGLGNVDNTTDLAKPISTATQAALNGKSATGHTHLWADLTDKPSTFTPSAHVHSGADLTSGTVPVARLPLATTAAAGALSAADKTILDGATSLATASKLVERDASGRAQFATPSATADAATKGYADGLVAKFATASAAGKESFAAVAAGAVSGTINVTFPAGRFSAEPSLAFASNDARLSFSATGVSATGFSVRAFNYTTAASGAAAACWWTATEA